MVQAYANGQGQDPCTLDLINVARRQFKQDILAAENQQLKIRRQIKIWQKVATKFKRHSDETPDTIRRSMEGQVPPLEQQLRIFDEQIQMCKDAIKLLDGYTFEFDRPEVGIGRARGYVTMPTWVTS
jgi:hypothetical protein